MEREIDQEETAELTAAEAESCVIATTTAAVVMDEPTPEPDPEPEPLPIAAPINSDVPAEEVVTLVAEPALREPLPSTPATR